MVGGTALFALASLSLVRDTYEDLTGPAVASRQNDLLQSLSARLDTMMERGRTLTFNQASEFLQDAADGSIDLDGGFARRLDEANTRQAGLEALVVIDRGGNIVLETVPDGYEEPGEMGSVDRGLVREFTTVFAGEQPWGGIMVHRHHAGLLAIAPIRAPGDSQVLGYIALYDAFDEDLRLPDLRDGLDGVTFEPVVSSISEDVSAVASAPLKVERDEAAGIISVRSDGMQVTMLRIVTEPPVALTELEDRTIRDLILRVILFGAAIGLVLLLWFERRLLSRLSTLTELVGAAAAGDVDERPTVALSGSDELTVLASRIEETLGSLEEARDDLSAANDALVAADHAKNSFISVVSHELRTPLTAILGFTETLRRHWGAIDADRRQDFLTRMSSQASALDRMVEDLLVLSRMQSGNIRYEPETLHLSTFLEEAVQAIPGGESVDRRDVEDVAVIADPDHLRRIVTNYVENAFKYGRPPVRVLTTRSGDRITLRVVDAGDGVPEAFEPQLFERFTQASSGDTRESSGVGLGLSIVRQLAEHNGGRAWYERYEGQPCFAVSLPLTSVTDPARRLSPA